MNSVVSYQSRGKGGNNKWRGNLSGELIRDLIKHFAPAHFVDICEGSGTSGDVCKELGVRYTGLDLHKGFDFTTNSVLRAIGNPADLVFSHPPYFNMVDYVAERAKHGLGGSGFDLSRCESVDQFLELSQLMLMNQRAATKPNGTYSTVVGDYRKNGRFLSFQSDFIKLMPKDELHAVVIKLQHNQQSSFIQYANTGFIPIMHEYCIIWKRIATRSFSLYLTHIEAAHSMVGWTWKNIVRLALMNIGGKGALEQLYSEVERIADERLSANHNYKAKVRQTLQRYCHQVSRGSWALNNQTGNTQTLSPT